MKLNVASYVALGGTLLINSEEGATEKEMGGWVEPSRVLFCGVLEGGKGERERGRVCVFAQQVYGNLILCSFGCILEPLFRRK